MLVLSGSLISFIFIFFSSLLSVVSALPTSTLKSLVSRQDGVGHSQEELKAEPWDAGAVQEWPIHESCNVSQTRFILKGLDETVQVATHARAYILRWANESEIYRKYFGNAQPYEALGAYAMIVNGDRAHVLFRCDNPDGHCDNEGWPGYWRGANGSDELVLCDLSFQESLPLENMCMGGYAVADPWPYVVTLFAANLFHALNHLPAIGRGYIEHYTSSYAEVLEAAANNSPNATRDTDGLQSFAFEAYAYDIAVPGVGCAGTANPLGPGPHGSQPASSTTPTATLTGAASATSPPSSCHTHIDGEVHCG